MSQQAVPWQGLRELQNRISIKGPSSPLSNVPRLCAKQVVKQTLAGCAFWIRPRRYIDWSKKEAVGWKIIFTYF
jgi:hypothetical protein